MQATSNVIDQEKMAVILQEVVGNQYGDRYYPSMSGVARSLDGAFPVRHTSALIEESEATGIHHVAECLTRFYALDLKNAGHDFSIDDGFNLLKLIGRICNK